MKPNHRVVWVKVEFVQSCEIPVEVPLSTGEQERSEAMKVIAARPPSDRLNPSRNLEWRYAVTEEGI